MSKGIELCKQADALWEELKSAKEVSNEQVEKFEKLLEEFFKEPIQKSGFSSDVIWKKINAMFEEYFKNYYVDFGRLQDDIDSFFTKLVKLYDLNTVYEILESNDNISLSDAVMNFYDSVWDEVRVIAEEVAMYLAKEHVDLDGMSEMETKSGQVMSKFIDHPNITKRKGLWIRVWIAHDVDNSKKLCVRMIIVPQEEGGAAIPYNITDLCKKWLDTLA